MHATSIPWWRVDLCTTVAPSNLGGLASLERVSRSTAAAAAVRRHLRTCVSRSHKLQGCYWTSCIHPPAAFASAQASSPALFGLTSEPVIALANVAPALSAALRRPRVAVPRQNQDKAVRRLSF